MPSSSPSPAPSPARPPVCPSARLPVPRTDFGNVTDADQGDEEDEGRSSVRSVLNKSRVITLIAMAGKTFMLRSLNIQTAPYDPAPKKAAWPKER